MGARVSLPFVKSMEVFCREIVYSVHGLMVVRKKMRQNCSAAGAQLQPKGLLDRSLCDRTDRKSKTFLFSTSHYFEFRVLNGKPETVNYARSWKRIRSSGDHPKWICTLCHWRYREGDQKRLGDLQCIFIGRTGVVDLFGRS